MNTRTLPLIEEWPYTEVASAMGDFRTLHGRIPACVIVGIGLWMMLREVSDSTAFLVGGAVPIYLDATGILEAHEFILSGVEHD